MARISIQFIIYETVAEQKISKLQKTLSDVSVANASGVLTPRIAARVTGMIISGFRPWGHMARMRTRSLAQDISDATSQGDVGVT